MPIYIYICIFFCVKMHHLHCLNAGGGARCCCCCCDVCCCVVCDGCCCWLFDSGLLSSVITVTNSPTALLKSSEINDFYIIRLHFICKG